jgi:hypothetical protein
VATSRETAARNEKSAHDAEVAARKAQQPDASTLTDEPIAGLGDQREVPSEGGDQPSVIVPSPEPREPQNPHVDDRDAEGFQPQSENAPVEYFRVRHPDTGVETEVTAEDFKRQFEREGFTKVGK